MNKGSVGLIQVSDEMVKAGIAGASVSWELADEVFFDEFSERLKGADFACLPEPSTPASALQRVMTNLFQKRDVLVKPVKNPNGSKSPAYGVLPKHDEAQGKKISFVQEWAVGLDKSETDTTLFFSENAPQTARDDLDVLYPAALAQLGRTELSGWLVTFVRNFLRGVPTVGGAGTYFIGPEEVVIWRKLRAVVKEFGIRLYEIPAVRSDQALECIVESVRRYTLEAVGELQADLAKYQAVRNDPDPRKRGIQARVLESRTKRIEEQLAVVEKYEGMFNVKLEELSSAMSGLRAGFLALSTGALTE